jgi:hypothetical protein
MAFLSLVVFDDSYSMCLPLRMVIKTVGMSPVLMSGFEPEVLTSGSMRQVGAFRMERGQTSVTCASRGKAGLETKEKQVPTSRFAETHTRPTDPGRAGR